jgi:hypothetical protein
MGLEYMALAASVETIGSAFASRDDERYQQVLNSDKSYVRSLLLLDGSGTEAKERKWALRGIFTGSRCNQFSPHHYGYAMEALCFQFGMPLGEVGGSYGALEDARAVVVGAGGQGSLLPQPEGSWFVPIPDMVDWPTVATISSTQCKELADALGPLVEGLPAGVDDASIDFLRSFCQWYRACVAMSRDLIIVSH